MLRTHQHDQYGTHGTRLTRRRMAYGSDPGTYGYGRPRGLKGMIIDAIVRKLLRYS